MARIYRRRSAVKRDAAFSHECSFGYNYGGPLCRWLDRGQPEILSLPVLADHFRLPGHFIWIRGYHAIDAAEYISRRRPERFEDGPAPFCHVWLSPSSR